MVNVCFSKSAFRVLQQAVEMGYLISSETVCIPDDLSLGDISNLKRLDTRKSVLQNLDSDAPRAWTENKRHYSDFFEQIYRHEKVLIWYANTPAEYCGMLYTVWLLKETSAKIGTVCCSRTLKRGENQYLSCNTVSDLAPEEVIRFLPFETVLTPEESESYISEWEKLSDENAPLRICWNSSVQSADISYYDDVILQYLSREPQVVSEVVQRFSQGEQLGLSDFFVRYRLAAMVKNGTLSAADGTIGYRDLITLIRPKPQKRIINIEQPKAVNQSDL